MPVYRILAVLALVGVSLAVAVPASRAQSGSDATVSGFILALNNGDLATAANAITSDFTLTFADGTVASGADALSQIVTPITVISLAPSDHQVSGVLQFGSDVPMNVTFTGAGGMIATMTILGPAS